PGLARARPRASSLPAREAPADCGCNRQLASVRAEADRQVGLAERRSLAHSGRSGIFVCQYRCNLGQQIRSAIDERLDNEGLAANIVRNAELRTIRRLHCPFSTPDSADRRDVSP